MYGRLLQVVQNWPREETICEKDDVMAKVVISPCLSLLDRVLKVVEFTNVAD
jgi:hypothetical protein